MVPSPKRQRLEGPGVIGVSSGEREQKLLQENVDLKQRIDELEASLHKATRTIEDFQKEKEDQNNQQSIRLQDIIAFPNKMPLSPYNIAPHLQELFQELVTEAKDIRSWDETDKWFRKVEVALKDYPILAQVASKPLKDDYSFLLSSACHIWDEGFIGREIPFPMPTFDLLISSNPYALAWNETMYTIATGFSMQEFDLFLSIVSKYTWVLDVPEVARQRPIEQFLEEALLVDGDWDSVTKFYKSQPKFSKVLDNSTGRYPLHKYIDNLFDIEGLMGSSPDAFFEFMVQIFPAALLKQDKGGNTPLHIAFFSVQNSFYTSNDCKQTSITAGRILLKENPSALLVKNKEGCTPLECLQLRPYHDESVREFAVEVLRVYFPRPLTQSMKKIPFLPTIYAMLEKEAAFANNCVRIKRVCAMIRNYCNAPTDPSNSDSDTRAEINQIYSDWANENLAAASKKSQSFRETDIPRMVRRRSSGQDHH